MGSCQGRGLTQLKFVPSKELSWWGVVMVGIRLIRSRGAVLLGSCPELEVVMVGVWPSCPELELSWWGVGMVGFGPSQELSRVGFVLVRSCPGMGSCYGRGLAQLNLVPSRELSWWGVVPSGVFSRWEVVSNVLSGADFSWWGSCSGRGLAQLGVVPSWNCPGGELVWQGLAQLGVVSSGICPGDELYGMGSCYGLVRSSSEWKLSSWGVVPNGKLL